MSFVLQVIAVGLVVASCALYSIWRLLSGAARQRTLAVLARLPGLAHMGWFMALTARTQARMGAGCGSCSASATAASRKQTPGALPR